MKIAFEIEIDRRREQLSIWKRMNILSSDSNHDSVQRDRFDWILFLSIFTKKKLQKKITLFFVYFYIFKALINIIYFLW